MDQTKGQNNNSGATPSIITLMLLFFFYPVGLVVMWVWPKWNKWIKIAITVVPVVLLTVIILLLPLINPITESMLGPLQDCVYSCNTKELNDPCIRKCQEDFLLEQQRK